VLALRDCSFAYRSAIVLDQVRLEQNAGEVLALLGPNGAGKSTLIRCICGRLTPDQGEVRVVGQDPRRSPAARAAIGLVPQQLALYPFLTVRENLAAFAALAGMKKAGRSAAVELTLLRSELGAVAGQPAGTLSGGWQRRLNIACAIVHQPRILVLDEPTVGVDPPARAGIEALLQRLAADGMAILITSHELDQLERLADRAAFLRDGRIVADGAPERLLDQAFGIQRECRIMFRAAPEPAQSGRLEGCGLQAHGVDRRNWSGLIDGERARTLPGELAGNSDVELLHLQRPGLSALWRSIYGTEPERTS
jgi:ABC-2 type transport system ATP-binding protein